MIPQHREEPLCQRELFRLASADCLRPGGVELTERGLTHCAFGGGERVADLGCGPGVTLALLAERGLSPVGMDRSAAMLQEAERRLSALMWSSMAFMARTGRVPADRTARSLR